MSQPIKKIIKETHADLIKEEPFYTLLVDGNSLLFSCMADPKINSDGKHVGGIFQFLLQLKILMNKINPEYVYVFFDNTYSGWLRWNIYSSYKQNRDKHYEEYGLSDYMKAFNDEIKRMQKYTFNKNKEKVNNKKESDWEKFINDNFDRERDILCNYFNELYIRWNLDDITEGDDQIAYYCLNKKPNEKIYIVSSDMDLSQLLAEDIAIYNQSIKKFVSIKNFKELFGYYWENVLIKKILIGDVSDNIGNIKGLSEEGLIKLIPEIKERKVTLEEVKDKARILIEERKEIKKKPLQVHENILNGISNKEYNGDFYEINKKIIDLKNPLLSDEAKETMDAMMYAPQDPEDRSFQNLYKLILEDKIEDLIGDTKFAGFFSTFKKLEEKEIKRFKDSQKD